MLYLFLTILFCALVYSFIISAGFSLVKPEEDLVEYVACTNCNSSVHEDIGIAEDKKVTWARRLTY